MAQFPASDDLSSFGLTPSAIKSIALPNDLQEWPTSALSGCTALERLTSFGEEVDTGLFALTPQHFTDCTNLKHIQPPSTVDTWNANGVFLNIQSIILSKNIWSITGWGHHTQLVSVDFSRCVKLSEAPTYCFFGCSKLSSIDLTNCKALPCLFEGFFYRCNHLTSVDLSGCTQIATLMPHCFGCATVDGSSLTTVIIPPSVTLIRSYAFSLFGEVNDVLPNLRTIIGKGRSGRGATEEIAAYAFGEFKTLDELVQANVIQEIFVP